MASLFTSPVCLVEGIVYTRGPTDGLLVQPSDGPEVPFYDLLSPYAGQQVEFHAHHLPADPPDPALPGGGSCLWDGHCPVGHEDRPGWLFRQHLAGTLRCSDVGWSVGGHLINDSALTGHRCRVLLVVPDALRLPQASDPVGDIGALINEASELAGLLKDLKKVVGS